jgi:hypothetical protein
VIEHLLNMSEALSSAPAPRWDPPAPWEKPPLGSSSLSRMEKDTTPSPVLQE